MAYHLKAPTTRRCPKACATPSPYQGCLMALEPRMLFDGAALAAGVDAATSQPDPVAHNTTQDNTTDQLVQAAALGTGRVTIAVINNAPTLTGVADVTVTANTTSNFDLSGVEVADADGDSLTLTLTVTQGAFDEPTVSSNPRIFNVELDPNDSDNRTITMTVTPLTGQNNFINDYLDTVTNIRYTGDGTGTFTVSVTDGVATAAEPGNIDILVDQQVIRHLPVDPLPLNDTPEEEEEPVGHWDNPVEITAGTWQLMEMGPSVILPGMDSCACANPEVASPDLGSCGTIGPDAVDLDIYLDTPPNDIIQYLPAGEEPVDPVIPDGYYQQSTSVTPDHGQALLAAADAIYLPDNGYGVDTPVFAQRLQAADPFAAQQTQLTNL